MDVSFKYWEILLREQLKRGNSGLTFPFLIGSQQYLATDTHYDVYDLVKEMAIGKNFETCIRYCMGTQTLISEIRNERNQVYYLQSISKNKTNLSVASSLEGRLGSDLDAAAKILKEEFQEFIEKKYCHPSKFLKFENRTFIG